jgi:hypothetical protein
MHTTHTDGRFLRILKPLVTFISLGACPSHQKTLEMPYPTAAIQTALMAITNPAPATGHAVRCASLAFAAMIFSLTRREV